MHSILPFLLAIICVGVATAIYPHFIVSSPFKSNRFYVTYPNTPGVFALDADSSLGVLKIERLVSATQFDLHGASGLLVAYSDVLQQTYLYVSLANDDLGAVVRFDLNETRLELGNNLILTRDFAVPDSLTSELAAPYVIDTALEPRVCVGSAHAHQVRCYRASRAIYNGYLTESWYISGYFDQVSNAGTPLGDKLLSPAYAVLNGSDFWIDDDVANEQYQLIHYNLNALSIPPVIVSYNYTASNDVAHIVVSSGQQDSLCALCVLVVDSNNQLVVMQIRNDNTVLSSELNMESMQMYTMALAWKCAALNSSELMRLRIVGLVNTVFDKSVEISSSLSPSSSLSVSPSTIPLTPSPTALPSPLPIDDSPSASWIVVDYGVHQSSISPSQPATNNKKASFTTWPLWLLLSSCVCCVMITTSVGALAYFSRSNRRRKLQVRSNTCMQWIRGLFGARAKTARNVKFSNVNDGTTNNSLYNDDGNNNNNDELSIHLTRSSRSSGTGPFISVSASSSKLLP